MGSRHKAEAYRPARWIDNRGPFLDTMDTEKTEVGSEMMDRHKVYTGE